MSTEVIISPVSGLIKADETKEKFGKIFSAVHRCSPEQGRQMHDAESFSFLKEIGEKNLSHVSPVSAMGVYLDVVRNGLSFSSASKHVYMMARNAKVGNAWEPRLTWDTTQDAKIFQCQRSGSIDRVTRPVIAYDGDTFKEVLEKGVTHVIYERNEAHGTKVIGGFVYVVYPDKTREAVILYPQDIERLKGYSSKQSKEGKPNALYTSAPGGQIDPGFFGSKIIKFALKNIRKSGTVENAYQVETDASDALYAESVPASNDKQIAGPVDEALNVTAEEIIGNVKSNDDDPF